MPDCGSGDSFLQNRMESLYEDRYGHPGAWSLRKRKSLSKKIPALAGIKAHSTILQESFGTCFQNSIFVVTFLKNRLLMKGKFPVLIFFLLFLFSPVFSQTDDHKVNILQVPLFFTESNPESPVGIFSLDFPFYFGTGNPSGHQLSFGYSMGNVWSPKAWFLYPQSMTEKQSQVVEELFMTIRPQYFASYRIPVETKTYQADGVLQHFRFTWLNHWKKKNSLIFTMNVHQLSTGKSPVHFFVSDYFIEEWHSAVAVEDNFGRRLYPFNRAAIEFEDEEGQVYRKDKGDVFLSVLDAHYYRELFSLMYPGWHLSMQAAVHLSVPLNDFHPYLIPGFSAGVRSDFRLGQQSSLTLAFDGGRIHQTAKKTGNGIHAIDREFRFQSGLYTGFNVQTKNRTVTFGILNQYQGPLMKGGNHGRNQTGYDEIGIRFLQEGDTWEGEPVSQQFWLAKLGPASLYYHAWRTFFILGFYRKSRAFNVFIGEDMITINNAPDFQVGFQYRFRLTGKKK